jgi:multidrug efflux pump
LAEKPNSSVTGANGAVAARMAMAARPGYNNTARNAFTNAIANTGHGSTSTGAAVSTAAETMIPLAAVSKHHASRSPLSVYHQGPFVASDISFSLQSSKSLGEAVQEIGAASDRIHMPISVHGTLSGKAKLFQQSLAKEPILIAAAIAVVYILLGVLYESYVHPITILWTMPSAGVGAIIGLILFHNEFDIIGMIGVILLIGIVSKNAIMMIDFAIEARRSRGLNAYDAILNACLLRFRPIMMTTSAALLGAAPLALSFGNGAEIRRPLGIAVIGGLIVSQLLTLYTTPILYLRMDQLSQWYSRQRRRVLAPRAGPSSVN